MVRYPDGETYMYYSLPIAWARAKASGSLDGKELRFSGFGNMNHDAGVIFPAYIPANWQVFWFFGEDHALLVTDHFTHEKFGKALTQRLVFVDKTGAMFTSTSFNLVWDDWAAPKGVRFHYPRHFSLSEEAGGAEFQVETRQKEILLIEDLFSNLPTYIRVVVERLTKNGWTADAWADYSITYTHDGREDKYTGRGVTRWCDLEEE
jgi:hypothetical protein